MSSFFDQAMSRSKEEEAAKHAVPTDEKIMDTILENIGKTPLVRINKITASEGIGANSLPSASF